MRKQARDLAFEIYKGIKYGEAPYTDHLEDVAQTLLTFGFPSDELGAAAWLHDSIEDRLLTLEQIHRNFGPVVWRLVLSVTDGQSGNRAFRKAHSFQKMQSDPTAIVLKLADRIANVEACLLEENRKLRKMYQEEQDEFRKQLDTISTKAYPKCADMWEHLQNILV